MIVFFSPMRRPLPANLALLGLILGFMFGAFAPMPAYAQTNVSILPTDQDSPTGTLKNCEDLRLKLAQAPQEIEGKALALKLRCGRLILADLPYYFQHALSFILNMIGTLAVIAVIRAGYIFMISKDKDYAEGRKAVIQVVIGLLISALSFTAAQIVLRALFAIQNASV